MASIASKNAKNKSKTKSKSKSKSKERLSLSELKTLGHQLLSSRAHINNLPILLSHVSPTSPPPHALESLLSLHSFFAPILSDLPSSKPSSTNHRDDDPELIYNTWVRSKFDIFVNSLIDFAASPLADETLKEVVLDTIMEFVKVANGGRFHSAIYHRLLHAIVHSTVPVNFVVDLLVSKYFKYIDVRYFTYISLEKLARTLEEKDISDHGDVNADSNDESHSKSSLEIFIHNIHYVISHIPPLEGSDEKSDFEMWSRSGGDNKELSGNPKAEDKQLHTEKNKNNVLSAAKIAKKMKLKFTKAWISFLRLQLPLDVYKEVLVTLHQAVIPYLSNPIMLCDFLTRSYDIGGVVSVMALSSLFILMTQHGLEYPNFYEKLYALLVPSIFMAKHRAKFFQLLDSCLKSTLLPAYLAAAFAKKLSRLSLSVPASGALVIIALIHNLLRRHPSINCLVHREVQEETAKETDADMSSRKLGIDHFDNGESNPIKSKAMKCSLWEIDTLRHHYCPPVSRFVLSLENDLTVRAKTTEMTVQDFSSGSYATIFGDEIRRRVKQVPLAFYKATPTSLFSESDFPGWTFKHDGKETIDGNDEKEITNISNECDNSSAKRQRVES